MKQRGRPTRASDGDVSAEGEQTKTKQAAAVNATNGPKKRSDSLPRFNTLTKQRLIKKRDTATTTQIAKALVEAHEEGERRRSNSVCRRSINKESSQCASPNLRANRKRAASPNPILQPPNKKMATADDLMRAISEVNQNVATMNARMQSFCTREDFNRMAGEIRDKVEKNTEGISKLNQLRKEDQIKLSDRVETIIDRKIASNKSLSRGITTLTKSEAEQERDYLLARRSMLVWPAADPDLTIAAENFLTNVLKIPRTTVETMKIEHVERMRQARRSRIKDEILIRFKTVNDRDAAQSYAPNLASVAHAAGLRLHLPGHLMGLFRQFEQHAGALKAKHPEMKRSLKFDDSVQSLAMDVKLGMLSNWQRIAEHEMRQISRMRIEKNNVQAQAKASGPGADDRRAVLMIEREERPPVVVGEDEEDLAA